jgi:hypothetical protein
VVGYRAPSNVDDHQAGGVARFRGPLGDQLFGKLVIEPGDEHLNDERRG